jgi:hypothetical protein
VVWNNAMSIISSETIKAIGGMVATDVQDEVADALGAEVEYRLREVIHVCWYKITVTINRRQ